MGRRTRDLLPWLLLSYFARLAKTSLRGFTRRNVSLALSASGVDFWAVLCWFSMRPTYLFLSNVVKISGLYFI